MICILLRLTVYLISLLYFLSPPIVLLMLLNCSSYINAAFLTLYCICNVNIVFLRHYCIPLKINMCARVCLPFSMF